MSKPEYFDAVKFAMCFSVGVKHVENYLKSIRIPAADITGNRLQNDNKFRELEAHCTYQYLLKCVKKPNFDCKYLRDFIGRLRPIDFADLIIFKGVRNEHLIRILTTTPMALTSRNFFVHLNHRTIRELSGCLSSLTELQTYVWDILDQSAKTYVLSKLPVRLNIRKKRSISDMDLFSISINEIYKNQQSLICDCKDVFYCGCQITECDKAEPLVKFI